MRLSLGTARRRRAPWRLLWVFALGFAVDPAALRRTGAAEPLAPVAPAISSSSPIPAQDDGIKTEAREAGHTRRFLEDRVHRDPEDTLALDRLASTDLQLLRLTGDFEHLARARAAAKASLAALPVEVNAGGLAVMARVEFESHHFAEARDLARQINGIAPDRADGFLILGDALLELGDTAAALPAWQEAQKRVNGGEMELAMRRARVALLDGKLDEAHEGFSRALDMAKIVDPPATSLVVWCLLQRGQLAFGRGDWENAEKDYLEAERAAPSFFATREHLAELRGAQRRFPEAVSLYQEVIAQTKQRPEFLQELGDLQAFAGRTEEARTAHEQALSGYLKSVGDGNAHYYHHLAGFYCDVQPDPEQALKWARRDIELRQSVYAYDTLAWAQYQNGQWPEAAEAARKAVATGIRDAHLLYHAGMILCRAGDLPGGGKLLREVTEANPKYFNTFHVHR